MRSTKKDNLIALGIFIFLMAVLYMAANYILQAIIVLSGDIKL